MCCHSTGRCSGFLSWFASWVTFPICPILSAPIAALSFVRSLRSGSAVAITRATLLSPFVVVTAVAAMGTTVDYARGRAHLHPEVCAHFCGDRATDVSWSIDPKSRLPIVSEPHRNGASRFMWRVNDRMARFLVKMAGPQKGSWTGDLPTVDQAGNVLSVGRKAGARDFLACPDLAMFAGFGPKFDFIRGRQQVGREKIVSPLVLVQSAPDCGAAWKVGAFENLSVLGIGPDFFVVLDPSGREVARYGDPTR